MTFNERWTPFEDEQARSMHVEGLSNNQIAKALQRSADSVRRRLNHLGKSEEERAAVQAVKRAQRAARMARKAELMEPGTPRHIIPDHVLSERQVRLAVSHTTITGWMMGDPLPGRSALDQRGR